MYFTRCLARNSISVALFGLLLSMILNSSSTKVSTFHPLVWALLAGMDFYICVCCLISNRMARWPLCMYISLTCQVVDRTKELLAKVISITEPQPLFSKVFLLPVLSNTVSGTLNVLKRASPRLFVKVLSHSIAQALESPAFCYLMGDLSSPFLIFTHTTRHTLDSTGSYHLDCYIFLPGNICTGNIF